MTAMTLAGCSDTETPPTVDSALPTVGVTSQPTTVASTLAAHATGPASTLDSVPPPATDATTAAPSTPAPPSAALTTAINSAPFRVAWIGGSEVVLGDVSLPAYANQLGFDFEGRAVRFEPYTKIAASAADSAQQVSAALAAGAEALIVTINPQWLYGRLCEGVEPAHAFYACLLEIAPVTGGADIMALGEAIRAARVPALLVLIPTSATALESPELAEPIAVANARLKELLPSGQGIAVLDEQLTAGREEFIEGTGFHDMVHATPSGAQQLASAIAGELLRLLQSDR